jgi:Flp pilus assembly protein TadD
MRDFPSRVSCRFLTFGLACLVGLSGCNQTSGLVMNESGKGYYSQGNYTAARRDFERALMDAPQNANYAFNLASAMHKQGDLIGAERMFRHALTLDPRHQPAHHEIASLLRAQGRVADAEAHLQEWAATQPYLPEAHIEQAWLQREQGHLAAAEQSLRTALQQQPNHPTAMSQLGQIYQDTGRVAQARELYQQSLALNPYQAELQSRQSQLSGTAAATYPSDIAASHHPVIASAAPVTPSVPMAQVSFAHPPGISPDAGPQMGNDLAWQPPRPVGSAPAAIPVPQIPTATSMPLPTATAMPTGVQLHPTAGSMMLTAPQEKVTGGPQLPAPGPSHGPLTMSTAPVVSPF